MKNRFFNLITISISTLALIVSLFSHGPNYDSIQDKIVLDEEQSLEFNEADLKRIIREETKKGFSKMSKKLKKDISAIITEELAKNNKLTILEESSDNIKPEFSFNNSTLLSIMKTTEYTNIIDSIAKSLTPEFTKLVFDNIGRELVDRVSQETDKINWEDVLSNKNLEKILRKASRYVKNPYVQKKVDLSSIDGTENKIARILEEFEGLNRYSPHNNPLIKQIVNLGDEAIEPLLNLLTASEYNRSKWPVRRAISDSLEKLLKKDKHKEIILKNFEKSDKFVNLIKKFQYPEAEDLLMSKIQNSSNGYVNNKVIDTALLMNKDRAIPHLIKHLENGRNVSYAAQKLVIFNDNYYELTEPLNKAATKALNKDNNHWDQAGLAKVLLGKGMKRGLELSLAVLRSRNQHSAHYKQRVADDIMRYTDARGSEEDIAKWIKERLDSLVWNDNSKKFE